MASYPLHTDYTETLCLCSQIFVFLLSVCLLCTIGAGIWEWYVGYKFQSILPWDSYVPGSVEGDDSDAREGGATVIAILVFLSYIIVLNTVVPISLYVRLVPTSLLLTLGFI